MFDEKHGACCFLHQLHGISGGHQYQISLHLDLLQSPKRGCRLCKSLDHEISGALKPLITEMIASQLLWNTASHQHNYTPFFHMIIYIFLVFPCPFHNTQCKFTH